MKHNKIPKIYVIIKIVFQVFRGFSDKFPIEMKNSKSYLPKKSSREHLPPEKECEPLHVNHPRN